MTHYFKYIQILKLLQQYKKQGQDIEYTKCYKLVMTHLELSKCTFNDLNWNLWTKVYPNRVVKIDLELIDNSLSAIYW